MKELILELDYMSGPIYKDVFDIQNESLCTGIDIIDTNKELDVLNEEIQEAYTSLYSFNQNEQAVSFDNSAAKAIKSELLNKLSILKNKLDSINDGTFVIVDHVTDYLQQW